MCDDGFGSLGVVAESVGAAALAVNVGCHGDDLVFLPCFGGRVVGAGIDGRVSFGRGECAPCVGLDRPFIVVPAAGGQFDGLVDQDGGRGGRDIYIVLRSRLGFAADKAEAADQQQSNKQGNGYPFHDA